MAAVNAVQDVASLRLASGYCPSLPLPIHGHVTPTWDLDNLPGTPDPLCSSSPTTTHPRSLRLLLRAEDNIGMSMSNSSSSSTFFGRLNVNCLEAELGDLETLSAFKLEVGMPDPTDPLAIGNGTICDKSYAEAMESLSSASTSNGDSDFGLMSSPELLVAMPIQPTTPNTPNVNMSHHYHSFSSPSPAQCPSPLSLSSPLPSSSSSSSSSNPNGANAALPQLQTPQACPSCAKSFSNSSALSKHRLTHSDERKYGCQLCGKAFKRQDHLNGHLLTHRQKKPYECALEGCGKSYCDARSLRRHQDNHHNPRPSPSPSGGNLSQGEESMTPTTPPIPGDETSCILYTTLAASTPVPAVATVQITPAPVAMSPAASHSPNEGAHQQPSGSAPAGSKKTHGQSSKARQAKPSNAKPKKSGSKNGNNKSSEGDAGDKDAGLTSSQLELIQEIMRQTQEQHRLMQEEQEKALQQAGSHGHASKKSSKSSGNGPGSGKSRQNPPALATSPRPADARPVECTICQRKFKNIPALNGHMRLHGGYLKKESEPKKSDKKDPQLPPLQTASVSVRALIEEKIIQRRSAANPLFAAQLQSHASSATETTTTTSNTTATSAIAAADHTSPSADVMSMNLDAATVAQLSQTPGSSNQNQHHHENTDPMDSMGESGLSHAVMDFSYEGLQPLSPETLNRALEVNETPSDSPGEVDSSLNFQANNVNYNSLLEDDVLHASLLLQDVDGLGDYSLHLPDMDPAQSRLLQATLQQYLVGADDSDLPTEATPMPSHHAFLPDMDPASFFFATPPSSTSSSSSLGCLADAHITAHASSALGGGGAPPPPYFPTTPTLENALIDPFMMDEPHSNALMWASPEDAQYLTVPCPALSHTRTSNHTHNQNNPTALLLEPWATSPSPVVSFATAVSTPTPTPSGKLFRALALKNSQKEKKAKREKVKPLKLKIEKGAKQRQSACGAGNERRAYWTGFPSLLRSPKGLAATGLAVTSYTPAPCLDPRRLTRGCYYTYWRTVEEAPGAETKSEVGTGNVKVARNRPRIHVGNAFQCSIPSWNPSIAGKDSFYDYDGDPERLETGEQDELCWSPEIEERLGTKQVEQFLLWSQGQLPCGPKTTEEALTCLSHCQNISQAKLRLLGMHSSASAGRNSAHILWSATDIERFTKALASTTKDFTAVAQQVHGKSREDCIRFYYTWKRASAQDYRRVQGVWKSNLLVDSSSCSSPVSPSGASNLNVKILHLHVHVQHAHHRQQDSYPCKICGKLFSKVKSRSAHMKTHKPPELRVKSMTSSTPQSQIGSFSTSPMSGPASCPTPSPVGL